MGAAELVHEVRDNSMEVEAVVEAVLGEVDEVVRRDGHVISVLWGRGTFMNKKINMNAIGEKY